MTFRVWLKSRLADKVLAPLREEIVRLIPPGSTILDVGCGTGDLLFRSASKLERGYGVDIDEAMTAYAEARRRNAGLSNVSFLCGDIRGVALDAVDIVTSTLCLHEVGIEPACEILERTVSLSRKVFVADYSSARTLWGRIGIELDERISGHYRNFRAYKRCGEIPYIAKVVGARIEKTVRSTIDGISIWVIDGKATTNG